MQTALEKSEGLKRKLTVKLPTDKFKDQHKKHLTKTAKKAKIDGFRPGKAPMDVVAKQYGAHIYEAAVDDLINQTLPEALKAENLRPVSRPTLENLNSNDNDQFEYIVSFEVAPEINAIKFDNVTIEKTDASVQEQDIDNAIADIRKQFGHFVAKDGAAENDDQIFFDFEGSINGELFEGGSAKNHKMVLGSGQMIPGFEDQIVGMKPGDEKVITVTFPETYAADLAGKEAQFKINLHKVEKHENADLTPELVKKVGLKNGELADLRVEIRKTLERELKNRLHQEIQKTVFDKLTELNPLDLPESVVHDEIHVLMDQAKERFKNMFGGKMPPNFELPHDMFREEAKKRVLMSYLLLKIIEDQQFKPSPEAVEALAEEMAASYENPVQVRDYFLRNKDQLQHLQNIVVENAVLDYLLGLATVNTVKKTYKEAIGK